MSGNVVNLMSGFVAAGCWNFQSICHLFALLPDGVATVRQQCWNRPFPRDGNSRQQAGNKAATMATLPVATNGNKATAYL